MQTTVLPGPSSRATCNAPKTAVPVEPPQKMPSSRASRRAVRNESFTTCETVLVPARNAVIDRLVEDNDYYAYSTIPGGMYEGNPDDVTTFGVKATFVTSTALPDDVAYEVVKAVFENFNDFKRLHPAFGVLQQDQMIVDALSAPLHDGAARYYSEAGLM